MRQDEQMTYFDVLQEAINIMNESNQTEVICECGNVIECHDGEYNKYVVLITEHPYMLKFGSSRGILEEHGDGKFSISVMDDYRKIGKIVVMKIGDYYRVAHKIPKTA